MSKSKNIVQTLINYKTIIGIQVLASAILMGILLKLGALPMMYMLIVLGILILLLLLMYLLVRPSKKKNKGHIRNTIGKLISIILSIVLLFGSLKVAQGDSTLAQITGAKTQVTRISVVVLDESPYQKLSDLKNETVEVNTGLDTEKVNEAITAMQKEESTIRVDDINDYEKMADHLYAKSTNAILVNEAYFTVLESKYENFENETRVIWTYEIKEDVGDVFSNVNVTQDVFTIYISGIDTTGPVSTVSRSDVNMLVTVNPKTKQILMTSIPRDYYVTLADRGQKDKLTHAGISGVENSVETIENFIGIDINYYARVNFTSLVTMVDALGGITVNSPVAFTTMHGGYQIVVGDNYMNGEQALGFVRERYSLAGGDNDRVKNQQRVLAAMLDKAMSPAIITNYSKVLKSIEGCFETNMSSKDITSLIQMQLGDMAKWDIMQIQLSGSGTMMTGGALMPNNRLYYMIPDQSSIDRATDLIKRMDSGETISIDE